MKDNDLSAIEQTIERYPWYSAAHLELYKRLSELGEEQRDTYLHKAAAYLYSREKLYDIVYPSSSVAVEKEVTFIADVPVVAETDFSLGENIEKKIVPAEESAPALEVIKENNPVVKETDFEFIFDLDDDKEITHKVIIAGGDYFSRNDFETIELDRDMPLDRFIVEKPSLLRSSLISRESPAIPDQAEIDASELFEDSGFYTETLAKIYTSQGFYKRALDVYAKLILLYPEKSTYFATLVKELKTKHNT